MLHGSWVLRIVGVLLGAGLVACGSDGSQEAPPCNCPSAQDAAGCAGASGSTGAAGSGVGVADASTDSPPDATNPDVAPPPDSSSPEASAPMLRLMTFNIKHGAESSLGAIADVILAEKADIVGLQEVDVDADRSGNVDQPHRLGQLTGMGNLFRSALTLSDGGLYGLAVLSRYPIVVSQKLNLTSASEQRILAMVDIDVNGTTVPFCITHLGLTAAERTTQVNEILAAIQGKPWAVLVGDMNATPNEASMKTLSGKLSDAWVTGGSGDGFTIPVTTPTKRIDYVFLGSSWSAPVEAHVPATPASDHLPVVVTIPAP